MSIKLGISPIAWSNDDMPELGGELGDAHSFPSLRSAGLRRNWRGTPHPPVAMNSNTNVTNCSGPKGRHANRA